jgi:hypothetical protein
MLAARSAVLALFAAETLRGDQFVFVGQLFEDNSVDGSESCPRQIPSRQIQQALGFAQPGVGRLSSACASSNRCADSHAARAMSSGG